MAVMPSDGSRQIFSFFGPVRRRGRISSEKQLNEDGEAATVEAFADARQYRIREKDHVAFITMVDGDARQVSGRRDDISVTSMTDASCQHAKKR